MSHPRPPTLSELRPLPAHLLTHPPTPYTGPLTRPPAPSPCRPRRRQPVGAVDSGDAQWIPRLSIPPHPQPPNPDARLLVTAPNIRPPVIPVGDLVPRMAARMTTGVGCAAPLLLRSARLAFPLPSLRSAPAGAWDCPAVHRGWAAPAGGGLWGPAAPPRRSARLAAHPLLRPARLLWGLGPSDGGSDDDGGGLCAPPPLRSARTFPLPSLSG